MTLHQWQQARYHGKISDMLKGGMAWFGNSHLRHKCMFSAATASPVQSGGHGVYIYTQVSCEGQTVVWP